jgi:methionyl-tRNA formyltransferase
LGNGRVAQKFLESLQRPAEQPFLVVLNEGGSQRQGAEIRAVCQTRSIPVAEWSPETRGLLLAQLGKTSDAWVLSVYFRHVLDAAVLEAVGGHAVNLHASLLPWCRGAHTNVYPIVDGCPAGVTLHAMTGRVDGGQILAQVEVPVHPWDTGGSLYGRLEDAAIALLQDNWPGRVLETWPGLAQPSGGSVHKVADLSWLESYSLDDHPEARGFFNLLRARTFPPYRGLVVELDGRRIEATVELREAADG